MNDSKRWNHGTIECEDGCRIIGKKATRRLREEGPKNGSIQGARGRRNEGWNGGREKENGQKEGKRRYNIRKHVTKARRRGDGPKERREAATEESREENYETRKDGNKNRSKEEK